MSSNGQSSTDMDNNTERFLQSLYSNEGDKKVKKRGRKPNVAKCTKSDEQPRDIIIEPGEGVKREQKETDCKPERIHKYRENSIRGGLPREGFEAGITSFLMPGFSFEDEKGNKSINFTFNFN